jgi:hypothetical protein
MTQPNEFVVKCEEDRVYKLQKSLYDLKQAPKQCHEKFNMTLTSADFSVNEDD